MNKSRLSVRTKAWLRCLALTAGCFTLVAMTNGAWVVAFIIPWLVLAIELNEKNKIKNTTIYKQEVIANTLGDLTGKNAEASKFIDKPGGKYKSTKNERLSGEINEEFQHNETTLMLNPEAEGHFCMLWGEHGHGGYCSQSNAYIQGGQPMDSSFDLAAIYSDFEEAKKSGSWQDMRSAINNLRQQRRKMEISQTEERQWWRADLF